MIRRRIRTTLRQRTRRGVITLIVAISLVVLLACIALALDRLWLHSAVVELSTCAEAASLAAAGELAGDDLLRDPGNSQRRIEAARDAAETVALKNLVAGRPVQLDLNPRGDVRFGRIITQASSGNARFLETSRNPTSVVVAARRTRARSNPVALLFAGWSGQSVADVVQRAEATIDNRVSGVRPLENATVPALPLAILAADNGKGVHSWKTTIEGGTGLDQYAFNPQTGRVQTGQDRIRELTLRTMQSGGSADGVNVLLVDVGNGLNVRKLVAQVEGGWTADDLSSRGGEMLFDGPPLNAAASAIVPSQVVRSLNAAIGQCRICLLYDSFTPADLPGQGTTRCVGLVAGRIMSLRTLDGGAYEIVLQPGVITTRTAVLAESKGDAQNTYIYKLHLTQ